MADFRIHGWSDLLQVILSVAIVLIIVFMLVDFISWREAIDMIKKEIPTNGLSSGKWIKGFGYVPFAWRGSLNAIFFLKGTEDNLTTDGEVWCKLENTKFVVPLKDGWGEYHITRTTIQDPDDPNYGQPDYRFQDFQIFVRVLDKGEKVINPQTERISFKNVKLLVVYETEKGIYPLIWKTTAQYVGCGGGIWMFHLGKY